SAVTPEYAFDVEGGGRKPLRHAFHLGRSNEQKYGAGIDEATDQPWTGDAVNLGSCPRYPDGPLVVVERGHSGGDHQGQAGLAPTFKAVVQRVGRNPAMTHPGRRALAELGASLADRNSGTAGKFACPCGNIDMGPTYRARNQARIGFVVVISPHIDQSRAVGSADEAGKLVDGNRVHRGHGSVLALQAGRDSSACRLVGGSLSPCGGT